MSKKRTASVAAVAAVAATDVDPTIWRASAGSSVHIPYVGSRVYYFPQGHFEQCISNISSSTTINSSPPPSSSQLLSPPPPFFHCRVLSVRFLAHPLTDEPFASLQLLPIPFPSTRAAPHVSTAADETFSSAGISIAQNKDNRADANDDAIIGADDSNEEDSNEDDVVAFAKILTPSDANNGGGFSVPRFCADAIFPPLNFAADPPVQNLIMRDVHRNAFEFRHIYRGTPRRHLLTTGWSKFVNSKKLVAGDSVVFMRRRSTGELYAGVRRAKRGNDVSGRWNCPVRPVKIEETGSESRNEKGKVLVEAVVEALELAVRGMAFEVVSYPRPGWSEFVVKAEAVEEAMGVFWTSGMRVKMAMETEDSTRTTWFQGSVLSATVPENGPWCGSPWRMLQITWDEPEILQHVQRVSPWQVEYVVTTSLQAGFPPTKKLKALQNAGFLPGEGVLALPMAGLNNSLRGQLKASLLEYSSFPAGMQGARQIQHCESILSDFSHSTKNGIHQISSYKVVNNNMKAKLETLSTELNIGSSLSENVSLGTSANFCSTELVGQPGSSCSEKVSVSSFQLFGKIIHMVQPAEGDIDDKVIHMVKPAEGGINEVGSNEERNHVYKQIEGSDNLLDLYPTYSYAKLIDRLEHQYHRASAVEPCSL